jgi:hypothetical protein
MVVADNGQPHHERRILHPRHPARRKFGERKRKKTLSGAMKPYDEI